MKLVLNALAGIAMPVMVCGLTASVYAQSCVDEMAASMQQMAQNALQCGESAQAIGSLTENGVISGEIPPETLEQMCQSGVDVNSQLSAFNECSRVYVCATAAYAYALENIGSFGGDCTAAANAGLAHYPVQ